jgi:hypothetical protein
METVPVWGFCSPVVRILSPNFRTPNPGFNPGFIVFFIKNAGGEHGVKPGVRHPEMWALYTGPHIPIRSYCLINQTLAEFLTHI